MNKRLKIAFIEVGHWHARIYLNFIKKTVHKIIAVSEREYEIAKKIGEEYDCHYYQDYYRLLEKEKIDFVFTFGRHYEMAQIVNAVLERGLSLCTEKPITNDAKIMQRLTEKAEKKKLFTDVALPLRFSPIILSIKTFCKRKDFVEIVHCYFRHMVGPLQRYIEWGNAWMLKKRTALGGTYMNEGPHYIDLFRYLTGEEIKYVFASTSNSIYGKNIEDNFSTILETSTEKRAVIETCYGYPSDRNWRDIACTINTTNYLFTLIDIEEPREFRWEVRCRKNNKIEKIDLLKYNQNVYEVYLEKMLSNYLNGKTAIVPFSSYYNTVKVLEASYQSARNRKVIKL